MLCYVDMRMMVMLMMNAGDDCNDADDDHIVNSDGCCWK